MGRTQAFQEVRYITGVLMTIKNTLVITSLKLVVCFPAPIILALLLNEVKAERFKRPFRP